MKKLLLAAAFLSAASAASSAADNHHYYAAGYDPKNEEEPLIDLDSPPKIKKPTRRHLNVTVMRWRGILFFPKKDVSSAPFTGAAFSVSSNPQLLLIVFFLATVYRLPPPQVSSSTGCRGAARTPPDAPRCHTT